MSFAKNFVLAALIIIAPVHIAAATTALPARHLTPVTQTTTIGTHLIPVAEAGQHAAAPAEYLFFSVWSLLVASLLVGTIGALALRRFVRRETHLHTQKLF